MLFLLYYAALMHPRPTTYYADALRLSLAKTCLSYLDPLAWLFVAFALGRTYRLLRRRASHYHFGMAWLWVVWRISLHTVALGCVAPTILHQWTSSRYCMLAVSQFSPGQR